MPAIIQIPYRVAAAKAFLESFDNGSNYYLGLGKITDWLPNDENPLADDTNPIIPIDRDSVSVDTKRNIFGLKKITSSNIRLTIPRHNWTSGTIYAQYDSTDEYLFTKNFYVYTEDFKIFKCLRNAHNTASVINPNTIINPPNGICDTNDGYIWKYMYTISESDYNNFATANYIPIKNTVSPTLINGQIHAINVIEHGSGYSTAPTITIKGNGTIQATAIATVLAGELISITITNAGSGYTYATVEITSGTGSDATAIPIISPYLGHGYSNIDELFAFNLMVGIQINFDESTDFLTNNDFRQITLLKNPLTYGHIGIEPSQQFTGGTARTTYKLTVNTLTGFTKDQFITIQRSTINIGTAIVAEAINDGGTYYIYLTDVKSNDIIVGDIIHSINATDALISAISYPEVDIYTGALLYCSNRTPVTRDITQTETIKTPFRF